MCEQLRNRKVDVDYVANMKQAQFVCVKRKRRKLRGAKICTNQQPPQRGDVVPDPVCVGLKIKMAVGLPEDPSYPMHSP